MSGRGRWAQLAVVALLLGLWLLPVQAQEQYQPSIGQGAEEPDILLSQMDQLYRAGKFADAIPFAERYARAVEVRHGTDGPEYALAINNLAHLLQAANRLAEAEPLMRRAFAIDEKHFGPTHPKVALRLNNLARLLQATNRLAEAEPLMRRALAIDERSFGPEHPNVAMKLNNLASLLQATNR
jgi:tetratricopeptide (TPR) repeat protein